MFKEHIRIRLASPKDILSWTERLLPNNKLIGEIKKHRTYNFKTNTPITDGLFCQKIFGPTQDFQCQCGKYKKKQKKINSTEKIIICKNCNVEITKSDIRNYRMGYIKLTTKVIHNWYLRPGTNYISIIINKSKKYTINLAEGITEINHKGNSLTGADGINWLLRKVRKPQKQIKNIIKKLHSPNVVEKKILIYQKCIKVLNYFLQTKSLPEWMLIRYLPVLPPTLRPIIKMPNNTIITSDFNYLYQEILVANKKLAKIKEMFVTLKLINQQKQLLQIKVNNLINNEKKQNKISTLEKEDVKLISFTIKTISNL